MVYRPIILWKYAEIKKKINVIPVIIIKPMEEVR